jgi:PAS domain S-box-containing protein
MAAINLSDHELKRLQALYSFDILDSPKESSFDRLTSLASTLVDLPFAAICFFDHDRQWIKSAFGFSQIQFSLDWAKGHERMIELREFEFSISEPIFPNSTSRLKWGLSIPIVTEDNDILGNLLLFGLNKITLTPAQRSSLNAIRDQIYHELQTRKALRYAHFDRTRLELATQGSLAGLWDWDIVNNKLYLSAQWMIMLGYSPQELTSEFSTWMDHIHPDDRLFAQRNLEEFFKSSRNDYELEHRLRCKDGSFRWILSRGLAIRDNLGIPLRMTGWHIDIDAEKRHKQQILEEKEKFENLVHNIPIMLSVFDELGQIEFVNQEWTRVLGWDADSMKDLNVLECFYPDPIIRMKAAQAIHESNSKWNEFEVTNRQGKKIPTTWANVKLSSGKTIGIGKDISERKLRDQLIQTQQTRMIYSAKLSSLGEMAGGIAHEINNPLAIIHGRITQLLERFEGEELPTSSEATEVLNKVLKTTERIAKIVKAMKNLSRNGTHDPMIEVKLTSILEDALELCRERFSHNGVELRVKRIPDINLTCRPVSVAQIILNLLNNAQDAIFETDNSWVEIESSFNESDIFILVIDSGPGISEQTVDKMFEPFFTTKEMGKGTGLGLSISKGIVEEHGGSLEYLKEYPNTCFRIRLPRKLKV